MEEIKLILSISAGWTLGILIGLGFLFVIDWIHDKFRKMFRNPEKYREIRNFDGEVIWNSIIGCCGKATHLQ